MKLKSDCISNVEYLQQNTKETIKIYGSDLIKIRGELNYLLKQAANALSLCNAQSESVTTITKQIDKLIEHIIVIEEKVNDIQEVLLSEK